MNTRVIGFDLAKAYAIFGMYIVNFTFCFGSFRDDSLPGKFTNLFIGNSTSVFIICAGIGVMLLSNKTEFKQLEKEKSKAIILKRSWFLFILGLLLYNWWPGDILHFYGGYMHIAAYILFLNKRYYIWLAVLFILIYNILQLFIPITSGWNLESALYFDFWSLNGFLRNTFYNGWNSIFPWFAYFAIGMYLGKIDWGNKRNLKKIFLVGLAILIVFKGLRMFISYDFNSPSRKEFYIKHWFLLMEDYFPANIPYLMITIGFALVVITSCILIGNKFSTSKIVSLLAKTGQLTLTHYVVHITLGCFIFSVLFNKTYTGYSPKDDPVNAIYILLYSVVFFLISVIFSNYWLKKFNKGPIEILMRKLSKINPI